MCGIDRPIPALGRGQRKFGDIDILQSELDLNIKASLNSSGWVVIDGTGKNCAGIIAALSQQIKNDNTSLIEIIIPGILNIYDVIVWAENSGHKILNQRKEDEGTLRMLVQP